MQSINAPEDAKPFIVESWKALGIKITKDNLLGTQIKGKIKFEVVEESNTDGRQSPPPESKQGVEISAEAAIFEEDSCFQSPKRT